jgi:divalent metal cation (Fe/Co/Zn/Cd) transporter
MRSSPLIAGPERRRALVRPLGVAVAVHALLVVLQLGGAWLTGTAGITASALHASIGTAHTSRPWAGSS